MYFSGILFFEYDYWCIISIGVFLGICRCLVLFFVVMEVLIDWVVLISLKFSFFFKCLYKDCCNIFLLIFFIRVGDKYVVLKVIGLLLVKWICFIL